MLLEKIIRYSTKYTITKIHRSKLFENFQFFLFFKNYIRILKTFTDKKYGVNENKHEMALPQIRRFKRHFTRMVVSGSWG